MANEATLNISARIEGYQSSLQQFRKAIDQLDPGSSLRKSLEKAFKNAQDYITKLSKTPIVKVGNENQITKLKQDLQQASNLVQVIGNQFQNLTISDLNSDALNQGLKETQNIIKSLQEQMSHLAQGPQLNTLGDKVEELRDIFQSFGQNIDNLNAVRGIELLTQKLEESQEEAYKAKQAYEQVKAAADNLVPIKATGIFTNAGAAQSVRATLKKQFENIDFNQINFSNNAIQDLKNKIVENIKRSFGNDNAGFDAIAKDLSQKLDEAFNNGLNITNVQSKIERLVSQLKNSFSGVSSSALYRMMFGEKVSSGSTAFSQVISDLKQITLLSASDPLTKVIEKLERFREISEDRKIEITQLINLGRLEEAKAEIQELWNVIQGRYRNQQAEKSQLQQQVNREKEAMELALQQAQRYQQAINAIKTSPQLAKMTQQLQETKDKCEALARELEEIKTGKVNGLKQLAEDGSQAVEVFKLTTEQVKQLNAEVQRLNNQKQLINKVQGVLKRWFSIYAVVNMVTKAIRSMISTVSELDKTITNIAIVTDMSQSDLWAQMPTYTKMAREFAASISGVYEVSQLYYQQGLQTVDVMKLTESTLKMARISGLDYAESTDYMTNALRSFKMQMQDAERIVDVYSAVAASSATNVSQLAQAMSKTASSAQAVGATFENTTAMMAVMIEATRQAPENIGSALKSIISRYGELKTNPQALVDSQGEALSLNKVDTALQSVGISLHNAQGEFRNFDEVIEQLADSWNTIDVNTQRYIATIMAGNRQQSRFLALVSSGERLKQLMATATEAENAAQLQFLKTLDSVEAKQQQLQTSMQSLYTSTGIQNLYKGVLDIGASIINTFTKMPTIFNLPIPAILKFGQAFLSLSKIISAAFSNTIAKIVAQIQTKNAQIKANEQQTAVERVNTQRQVTEEKTRQMRQVAAAAEEANRRILHSDQQTAEKQTLLQKGKGFLKKNGGMIATTAGLALTTLSATMGESTEGERNLKAIGTSIGGILQGVGTGMMIGGPAGAIVGVLGALPSVIEAIGIAIETTEEKIERFDKAIEQSNNKKLIAEDQFKTLTDYKKKWDQLYKITEKSNEQKEEWIALNAEIANKYPELISNIDSEGNLIVDLIKNYEKLAQSKQKAYADTIIESGKTQLQGASDYSWIFKQLGVNEKEANKSLGIENSEIVNNLDLSLSQISTFGYGDFVKSLGFSEDNVKELATIVSQLFNNYQNSIQDDAEALASYIISQKPTSEPLEWTFSDIVAKYLPKLQMLLGDTAQNLYQAFISEGVNNNVTEYVKNIITYKDNFIKGIITSSIAQLRQSYDSILDSSNKVTGLAGIFMNQQLENSYQTYKRQNAGTDIATLWENWSKGQNLEDNEKSFISTYEDVYGIITTEQQSFKELDKHYQQLGKITKEQKDKLEGLYGQKNEAGETSKAWSTFITQYTNLQMQADQLLQDANFKHFTNYSANLKKRLASLKNKENFNVSQFDTTFAKATEEEMQQYVSIIQSSSLDTISGIEEAIAKYATSKGTTVDKLNRDPFVQLLKDFENSVKLNFNTEYQTLTESYTKNLKEFDKALKNATSGMGFEDAVALANTLGKTLADFRRVGEKWYYDNIQDITDKLMPGNDTFRKVLSDQADKVKNAFGGEALNAEAVEAYAKEYTEGQQKAWDSIDKNAYDKYHTVALAYKSWAEANNEDINAETWDKYISQMQQNFDQLDKAQQDLVRSHLLEIGKISEFLAKFDLDNTNISSDNLYQKALAGQLTGDLAKYQQQIIEDYQKSTKSVYDAAEKLLKGEVGGVAITVTDANDELLSKLTGTDVKFDSTDLSKTVVLTAQQINENWQAWLSYLNKDGEYTAEEIAEIQKLYKAKEKPSTFNSLKTAIGSYKQIDVTTYYNIPASIRNDIIKFDENTGKGVLNFEKLAEFLASESEILASGMTDDQVRELHTLLEQTTAKLDTNLIVQTLVKNHESLKEQNIQQISKLLNLSYNSAKALLISNGDGTYRIDLSKLQAQLQKKNIDLTKTTQDLIESTIEKQLQDAQKLISNIKDGFTSTDQMQKIVDLINKSTGTDEPKTINDLYEYNTALHAWILTQDGLSQYLQAINKAIEEASNDKVKEGLKDQKLQTLLKNNKLDEFLKEIGIIYPAYADAIKAAIDKGDYTELPEKLHTYIDEFLELRKDVTGQLISGVESAANSWNKQGFIKYEDLGGEGNVSEYLKNYGEILKDTGDGLLIDLAHTSVDQAQAMLVALYKQQGLAAGEAADKALSVVQNLIHSPVEDAIKVMQNIKNAAGGTNYSTARQLQEEFKSLGGNGELMKWNDVLKGYVYDAEQLQQFITLLKQKGDTKQLGVMLEQLNTELIKSGQLDTFLDTANLYATLNIGPVNAKKRITSSDQLIKKFRNGEQIEGLTADYYEALTEYLQSGSKEIIDGATSLLNGTAARTSVKVTAGNKAILAELTGETNLVEGALVQYDVDTIKAHMSSIIKLIQSDPDMGRNEKDKQIASIWEAYFTDANFYDAIKGVIDNPTDFDISAYQKLPAAMQKLATLNQATGKFSVDIDRITNQAWEEANLTLQQANEIEAKLAQSKREKSAANVLSEIAKNSTSLSEDNLKSLANLLKQEYNQVRKLVEQNSDGSFTMDLTTLRNLIKDKNLELNTAIQNSIAELIDHAIDMANSAASGQQSGYTKFTDMQKIMSNLQDVGFSYNFDQLFKWDATLKAYVSTTQGLFAQMALARQQLQGVTQEERKVAEQLIQGIGQQFREKIDFSSLYSAITSRDLDQQIIDDLQKAINDYNQYLVANGKEAKNYQDQINKILAGGQEGVQAAQELAAELNQKLSNSDIEAIYTKRSKALLEAMNQITAKSGAIVDDLTGRLIREAGGKVQLLANGSYKVIQSATNLYQTYLGIYEHLKNSGTATLEELNNIVAKAYQSKDQAKLTSLMSGLTDMTYSALANIFTAAGKSLDSRTINNLIGAGQITALGAGKIRINHFKTFAQMIGLDPTSEDYYKAFSAFNDQMININKQATDNIRNAANNVLNAKSGDQINILQIYRHLTESAQNQLVQFLENMGAQLENGILTINDGRNARNIYAKIMQLGYTAGKLVEQDLVEVSKSLMAHQRETNLDAVVQSIASNADQLTEDSVEQLAKALGISFNKALEYFAYGDNGYFKIDQSHLKQAIAGIGVSTETAQAIANMVSTQIENATSILNNISSNVSGFTNLSEVQSILDELNKNSANPIKLDEIAQYNTVLNKWMLRQKGIIMQIQMAAAQLQEAGYTQEQVTNQLLSMRQQLADSIDLMGYINSDQSTDNFDVLYNAISNFNDAGAAIGNQIGIQADVLVNALKEGGLTAVNALSEFALITKQKFTSEDYLTVFNQGSAKITKALEEMNVSVGSIISKESAEILGLTNFKEIDKTGQVLITSTVDMINAYETIISSMIDTAGNIKNGFTLADVNDAIINRISAEGASQKLLSQISGNTLDINSFKERITSLGYNIDKVIENMVDAGIAQIDKYTGNIKILDFDNFINDVLQLEDISTEKYNEALKTWNDAMITQITKVSDALKSDFNNLSNAKAGNYINITSIWNKIGKDRQDIVIASLQQAGAQINDGILYLTKKGQQNLVSIIKGLSGEAGLYNTREINDLIAAASKQQREASLDNLYLQLLNSRESLNEDNIKSIANTFGYTYDTVAAWLKDFRQANGTYKLSSDNITELFDGANKTISDKALEQGKKIIGSILDSVISNISGLSTKVFSLNQMSTLITDLKTKTGNVYSNDELFKFNKELGGYVLTTQGIYTQFRVASLEVGQANTEAQKLLQAQAKSFIDGINITEIVNQLQGNINERVNAGKQFREAIQKYNAAMSALGKSGLNARILLDNLAKGGEEAVSAARAIVKAQGTKLSDSDAKTIYRSRVEQLMQASQQLLNTSIGGIISNTTADLLDYGITQSQRLSADGSAVLKSAVNLIDAYKILYQKLEDSGAATLSELNTVMAQELSALFEKNAHGSNKGVDYLSKASKMTYEEFGQMLSQAGYLLTEQLFETLKNANIISQIGGGFLRIDNFSFIAKKLNLSQDSDEYLKAFKAYNDSLIQLDNEITDSILEEAKNVADARLGRSSKINFTYLESEFSKKLQENVFNNFVETLGDFGGYLSDGILYIANNANIPGLIDTIISTAKDKQILLDSQLAELADALSNILKGYADNIAKALSGGLTNTQASTLAMQAKNWFGIDINFTKAYDGIKISVDEANKLYQNLKQIDAISGQIVFNELKDSLTGTNEILQDASDIQAEIKRLQQQLKNPINANNEVLKQRLSLYKDIKIAQMDSAESYDWMSKSLPEGMQGVQNYWNSFGKAFTVLNQAMVNATKELKDGQERTDSTIAIQDFYNMVNEFNNLAQLSGKIEFLGMELDGSMQSAAAAIEKGYSAITNIDGKGAVINLTKLGVDFTGGAQGMTQGIEAGIKEMAEGQIKMLDGLIQFLETIVAMENLKDIAGKDNIFDFEQLYTGLVNGVTKTNQQTKEAANEVLQQANSNEDLMAGLKQVKVNGESLYEMFNVLASDANITADKAEQYRVILSSLLERLLNGDLDLNSLGQSVIQLAKTGKGLMNLDLGDKKYLVGRGIQLEYDKEGNIYAPDGRKIGTIDNPEAAFEKYQAELDIETINALKQGTLQDAEIQLADKKKLVVTGGQALVFDQNGVTIVNGVAYTDPEKAAAALAESSGQQIRKSVEKIQTFNIGEKTYISIQGHLVEKVDDTTWVDDQGITYDNPQAVANAIVLRAQTAWAHLDFSSFEDNGNTGVIDFGVGIRVKMNGDKPEYYVGDSKQPVYSLKEAKEKAISDTITSLKIGNAYGNLLDVAISTNLVTKLETGEYMFNGNKYTESEKDKLLENLQQILFPNGTLSEQAVKTLISQIYEIEPVLIYDQNKLKQKAADLKLDQKKQLQEALATGDKQTITDAIAKVGLGVNIEWKSTGAQASVGQLKQLAEDLGIAFDERTLSLTIDINKEDPIVQILNMPDTQKIDRIINIIAKLDKEQSDKEALSLTEQESSTSLNTSTKINQQLTDANAFITTVQQMKEGFSQVFDNFISGVQQAWAQISKQQQQLQAQQSSSSNNPQQSSQATHNSLLQEQVAATQAAAKKAIEDAQKQSKERENNELNSKISIYEQQIKILTETNTTLETKIKDYVAELETLRKTTDDELISKQKEIEILTDKLAKTKEQLQNSQQQLQTAQTKIAELQTDLDSSNSENQELTSKLEGLNNTVTELTNKNLNLEGQVSILTTQIQQLTAALVKANEENAKNLALEDFQGLIATLSELKSQGANTGDLEVEVTKLYEKINDSNTTSTDLQSSVNELSARIEALKVSFPNYEDIVTAKNAGTKVLNQHNQLDQEAWGHINLGDVDGYADALDGVTYALQDVQLNPTNENLAKLQQANAELSKKIQQAKQILVKQLQHEQNTKKAKQIQDNFIQRQQQRYEQFYQDPLTQKGRAYGASQGKGEDIKALQEQVQSALLEGDWDTFNQSFGRLSQIVHTLGQEAQQVARDNDNIKKATEFIKDYMPNKASADLALSLFSDNDLKQLGTYINQYNSIPLDNTAGVLYWDSLLKQYNQQANKKITWSNKQDEYNQLVNKGMESGYLSGWNIDHQLTKQLLNVREALANQDLQAFEAQKQIFNQMLYALQHPAVNQLEQQKTSLQQETADITQMVEKNTAVIAENTKLQDVPPILAQTQQIPTSWRGIENNNQDTNVARTLSEAAINLLDTLEGEAYNTLEGLIDNVTDNIIGAFSNEELSAAFDELFNYLQQHYPDNINTDSAANIDITDNGGIQQLADNAEAAGNASKEAAAALETTGQVLTETPGKLEPLHTSLGAVGDASQNTSGQINTLRNSTDSLHSNASGAAGSVNRLAGALNGLNNKNINLGLTITAKNDTGSAISISSISITGTAAAKGGLVGGKTLMGQLGPELVVSNGRYFVVGQAGAEMVSLSKDAIVFNHLQTQNLLKHEKSGGRGKPITNEHNAVSYAKGTGTAMASASAALATLKQIRAMWQSMLGASMRELGSLAGQEAGKSGGGGGGGGNDPEQIKAIVEEIERWYNLLRQIDRLQKDITYQQTLQSEIQSDRVANGKALYNSYKKEIEYLDQQIIKNQQLADLQKSWYERKRNELAQSDYGLIFTYNAQGQLQYKDGRNRGLDVLEKLTERNIYGETTGAAVNATSQIDYLKSIGFDIQKLKYNDDGTILDASSDDYKDNPEQIYQDMMENFWDRLDGWKDQLDGIYDEYRDQLNNVLSNETKRNELLQKIIDNQLSVEQDVLKAIESREQKLIDELQDERDALEKSTKDFIDGLTDQLNQEKQMYQNAESEKELVKLRRQVAILQRSGGSASQIRSLQDQIAAKEQDQYFTAQQQQIAAIQKASDLQLERMDSQIDLMTKTLEYQKENGLLWQEVYQIMASTPEQIRQFITENTPDFQSASALDVAEKIRDIDLRINEWVSYRDDETAPDMSGDRYYDWDSYSAAREGIYGKIQDEETRQKAKEQFDRVLNETGDINAAGAAADAILAYVLGQMTPEQLEQIGEQALDELINGGENGTSAEAIEKIKTALMRNNKGPNVQGYISQAWKNYEANKNTDNNKTKWTFNQDQKDIMKQMDYLKAGIDMYAGSNAAGTNMAKAKYNQYYEKLTDVNKKKKKYKKYAFGGLVTTTGLVQVDGTPSRPQAFLNAEQTELLRNNLFGSSDSLLSLARDIVQQLHIASYSSDTSNKEESGINIQNIDVNVNVKQIANDYDVRSIGNTVMDEMLKIARKSGTRGLNRR